MVQLGKDLTTQTEILGEAATAMRESQICSTNAIIASQEGIFEDIENLSYPIAEVSKEIQRDSQGSEAAEKLTAGAIQLTPEFAEAWYQNAQYNSQRHNVKRCIENLEKAIKLDKLYCLKADKDALFDAVRSHVNILFVRLRSEEAVKAAPFLDIIKQKHDQLLSILRDMSKDNLIDLPSIIHSANEVDREYGKLSAKRARNSYFDFLNINKELPLLLRSQESLIQEVKSQICNCREYRKNKITVEKRGYESKRRSDNSRTGQVLMIGSFAVPVFGILFLFPDWSKLWFLLFCIPVVSQIYSLFLGYNVVTRSLDALLSTGLQAYEQTLGWLLILYLFVAVLYSFIAQLIPKLQVSEELNDSKQSFEAADRYMQQIELIIKHNNNQAC